MANKNPFPFSIIPQNDDEKFMLEALRQAWKAFLNGDKKAFAEIYVIV